MVRVAAVVGGDQCAGRELRLKQAKDRQAQVLPAVQEHQPDRPETSARVCSASPARTVTAAPTPASWRFDRAVATFRSLS
jgi:hypothetical protein